jgi:amino acid transporter
VLFLLAVLVQSALVTLLDPRLFLVLAIAWTYLGLMCVEFFCRDWLKKRPVVYLLTHMGIMPLVDFFGTACEWLPRTGTPPSGLGWFLAASFCNGIVIEIGRKLRQPPDEEAGVETYSRLWGKTGGVAVWATALAATLACAIMAAAAIGFTLPVAIALTSLFLLSLAHLPAYIKNNLPGKRLETLSALWTLVLYLMLGLVPLLLVSHN